MSNFKSRATVAAFVGALSIAGATQALEPAISPAAQQFPQGMTNTLTVSTGGGVSARVNGEATGTGVDDATCKAMAGLINEANNQGDQAELADDHEGAQAWYDLANEFIRRGTADGCHFWVGRRVSNILVHNGGLATLGLSPHTINVGRAVVRRAFLRAERHR